MTPPKLYRHGEYLSPLCKTIITNNGTGSHQSALEVFRVGRADYVVFMGRRFPARLLLTGMLLLSA